LVNFGLPEDIARLTEYQQGLVLVGGPSGAGKTSTLAALLDRINQTRQDHIITVEDPIEYIIHPKKCQVTQREVGSHTRSFSYALRAALREDPDVIMVGEMRDLETISTTITAAETGHLVISSLHTPDAAQTIDRLIDVFPPAQQKQVMVQLAGCLQGVMAQILFPLKSGMGRAVATEVMIGTPGVRNVIREHKTHQIPTLIQTGTQYGMHSMDNSLKQLVLDGKVRYSEIVGYIKDPDILRDIPDSLKEDEGEEGVVGDIEEVEPEKRKGFGRRFRK